MTSYFLSYIIIFFFFAIITKITFLFTYLTTVKFPPKKKNSRRREKNIWRIVTFKRLNFSMERGRESSKRRETEGRRVALREFTTKEFKVIIQSSARLRWETAKERRSASKLRRSPILTDSPSLPWRVNIPLSIFFCFFPSVGWKASFLRLREARATINLAGGF